MAILTCVSWYLVVFLVCIYNEQYWVSFHVSVGHLYVFFEKCLWRSSARFSVGLFVFLLSCVSCLCVWEIKPLLVATFANIVSFHRLSFHFAYGFFAVQKLGSLIRSHLFICVFISIALGDWPKKTLLQDQLLNIKPLDLKDETIFKSKILFSKVFS